MRFELNLATHPYEDSGRFYATWVPTLALLAALAIGLSWFAWAQYAEYRRQNRELDAINQQIAELEKVKKQASDTLARPDNSGTRDQSAYLNHLIRRKAFSWTQVMADMEKLMPERVQVASIRPQVAADGAIEFILVVNTKRRDSGIELVRRMEGSPTFVGPVVRTERANTDEGVTTYTLEIAALYQPQLGKAAR